MSATLGDRVAGFDFSPRGGRRMTRHRSRDPFWVTPCANARLRHHSGISSHSEVAGAEVGQS